MSEFRKSLVRAHFEAYRDLTWAETLEPKLRQSGVDAVAMNEFRRVWNDYVENRDWDWWKDATRRVSNEQLDDERMDCIERLDQLGLLLWRDEQAKKQQAVFQDILNGRSVGEEPDQETSRTPTKDREI